MTGPGPASLPGCDLLCQAVSDPSLSHSRKRRSDCRGKWGPESSTRTRVEGEMRCGPGLDREDVRSTQTLREFEFNSIASRVPYLSSRTTGTRPRRRAQQSQVRESDPRSVAERVRSSNPRRRGARRPSLPGPGPGGLYLGPASQSRPGLRALRQAWVDRVGPGLRLATALAQQAGHGRRRLAGAWLGPAQPRAPGLDRNGSPDAESGKAWPGSWATVACPGRCGLAWHAGRRPSQPSVMTALSRLSQRRAGPGLG